MQVTVRTCCRIGVLLAMTVLSACGGSGGSSSGGGGGGGDGGGGPTLTPLSANTPSAQTIGANAFTYFSMATTINNEYVLLAYEQSAEMDLNHTGGLVTPITCDIRNNTGLTGLPYPEQCIFTASGTSTVVDAYEKTDGTTYSALFAPFPAPGTGVDGTSGSSAQLVTHGTPFVGQVTAAGTSYYKIMASGNVNFRVLLFAINGPNASQLPTVAVSLYDTFSPLLTTLGGCTGTTDNIDGAAFQQVSTCHTTPVASEVYVRVTGNGANAGYILLVE